MEQKQTIAAELLELDSSLGPGLLPAYEVPAGYFDGLAQELLRRVKALDAGSVQEELAHLSPLLSQLERRNPYQVPAGYFEEQDTSFVWMGEEMSAQDEISRLSPLLAGLQKQNPLSAPADYFDTLETQAQPAAPVKHISLVRQSWFRYAAAAVIVGLVAASAFLIRTGNSRIDPNKKSYAWVEKSMKKVGTETIDNFVELASSQALAQITPSAEVRKLMQDVPEKDIQQFLDDTAGEDPGDADDDIILN